MKIFLTLTFVFLNSFCLSAQWTKQTSNTTENLNKVFFINKNIGWITSYENHLILHTNDGGITWEKLNHNLSSEINSIYFKDSLNGYAGCDSGFYKTSDGGRTWQLKTIGMREGGSVDDFDFINDTTGWAIVSFYYGYDSGNFFLAVYYTSDNGESWSEQSFESSGAGIKVMFTDSLHGWLASYSAMKKTVDGGKSWTYISNNLCWSLFKLSNNIGWSVIKGGVLSKTTDDGETWQDNTLWMLDVYDLFFLDEEKGWALGSPFGPYFGSGYIQKTSDGGINWEPENVIGTLSYFYFIDENTGWSVGPNGVIYHYDSNSTGIYEQKTNLLDFILYQNYPNPFNPITKISFDVPKLSYIKLTIYNALGEVIERLVDEYKNQGAYTFTFDATNYPSGIYYYELVADNYSSVKRMALVK